MSLHSNVSGTVFTRAPAATDKYVPELDGIRAIAIAFVVTAHYQLVPVSVPGGFGVTLFFFLSGYLITTLFFSEYQATRDVFIPLFYLRRWIRLTPPLVIMVVISIIFFRVSRVGADGTSVPLGTTMAALFYYTNYYDLAWGMDPYKVIPFGVCWSLAIEEHFYLLWPLVIKFFIKYPAELAVGIAVACATVLVWRGIAHWGLGLSAEYTGMATDTRIDAILYGALLRVLFESQWRAVAVSILMNSSRSDPRDPHSFALLRYSQRGFSRDHPVLASGSGVDAPVHDRPAGPAGQFVPQAAFRAANGSHRPVELLHLSLSSARPDAWRGDLRLSI